MNAMNTTNTPTQPPDKCPACGCTEIDHDNPFQDTVYFDCGAECSLAMDGWTQWDKHGCVRAFSAAIALRAERDAALADVNNWRKHHEAAAGVVRDTSKAVSRLMTERDAALARAEKAEAQRDVYTGLYLFANQQHEQQETELQRYKEIMPCGHARMLEILNDGQMPECSVCWLARTEADRNALTARLAELQAVRDAARLLYNALKWLRHLSFTDDRVVWPGEETRLLVDGAIAAYDAALASGAESEMTK